MIQPRANDEQSPDVSSGSRLRAILSVVLVLMFVIAAVWYIRSRWHEMNQLRLLGARYVLLVALVFIINMGLRGVFMMQVLRALGVPIGLGESIYLANVTTMMNMLLPLRIGAGYRALYLRRYHDLPLTLFASTMAALYLLFVFVGAGAGLIAVTWVFLIGGPFNLWLVLLLSGLFLSCGFLIFAFPHSTRLKAEPRSSLGRFVWGWQNITQSRKLMAFATLTVVACSLFGTGGVYCGFRAFALPIDAPGALLMMSSAQVGGLLSLTPGAVGFQELVGLYFATVLTTSTAETFVVLGTLRLIRVLVAILVGLPSLFMLSHVSRKS